MNIVINGKEQTLEDGMRVADLLRSRKIRPEMVSVELNGEILHRDRFGTTSLSEGDKVEFLYYMGGGGSTRYKVNGTSYRANGPIWKGSCQ